MTIQKTCTEQLKDKIEYYYSAYEFDCYSTEHTINLSYTIDRPIHNIYVDDEEIESGVITYNDCTETHRAEITCSSHCSYELIIDTKYFDKTGEEIDKEVTIVSLSRTDSILDVLHNNFFNKCRNKGE